MSAVHIDGAAYVANSESDTVSVIEEMDGNYSNIANIPVGDGPTNLAVIDWGDEGDSIAYVSNAYSNTVSMINGTDGNYSNIADITVGPNPGPLDADQTNSMAYVATSNGVSVIYGISKQVQAGVSFDVNPFHAGRIECKDFAVPTNRYFYVDFRTQCAAQPNEGFKFSNWIENLGSNSSRTISASQDDWFINALDWLTSTFGREPKDMPATLNVTKFGSFTANFKELPPAIPPQYLATLFAVVASAFIGSWLTPTFIGWRRGKKQGNKLDYYHERIKYLYEDGKLDKNDIDNLDKLRDSITDEYARGRINKDQFDKLAD